MLRLNLTLKSLDPLPYNSPSAIYSFSYSSHPFKIVTHMMFLWLDVRGRRHITLIVKAISRESTHASVLLYIPIPSCRIYSSHSSEDSNIASRGFELSASQWLCRINEESTAWTNDSLAKSTTESKRTCAHIFETI